MARGSKEGPATLETIAELAGIHVSTVSRVLNGSQDSLRRVASPATAARIRKIAMELDYRPNPHAASLRTRRSGHIGVMVPRLSDFALATIYEGIEEEAIDLGLSPFVTNTWDRLERQRASTEMMLRRRVDGLIFGDAHLDGAFLAEVAEHRVPFVLVNRRAADHPSVTCDDVAGGRLAAEHLLAMGHRRVAVLAGEPFASTGADRTAGFVERYAEAGIRIPRTRIVNTSFHAQGGHEGARRILSDSRPPTALFVVNDFTAIGAIGAIRDLGARVGEDVAVVGYNDTSLAAQLPIPLTSIRSPMHLMGVLGMRMLHRLTSGEPGESVLLEPELVVRESSDPSLRRQARTAATSAATRQLP